jgi:deoxyadenosine/deoxycytidine kinase
VFARALFEDGMIDARDFEVYSRTYRAVSGALRAPDLMIYVRAGLGDREAPHRAARPRLRARRARRLPAADRGALRALGRAYDAAPLVVVDADRYDVVKREATAPRSSTCSSAAGCPPR